MDAWVTKDESWNLPMGAFEGHREAQGVVTLGFRNGELRIQTHAETTLRMTWIRNRGHQLRSSKAVVLPAGKVAASVQGSAPKPGATGTIAVKAGSFSIEIGLSGGAFKVTGASGLLFDSPEGFRTDRDRLRVSAVLPAGQLCYGLGEKTGFLDKRGRRYMMWNTDEPTHTPDRDPLYQTIPYLIRFDGAKTSGLFLDSTARSFFDLAFTAENLMEIAALDETLDLYFLDTDAWAAKNPGAGASGSTAAQTASARIPGPAAALSAWTELVGRMQLPPLWALGFQQCRFSYHPESKVVEVAETFRKKEIPCDVVYLDIDYMDGYRVFTWNRGRFPDPKEMTAKLKSMGFRVVTIIDPGVKKDSDYAVYVDGAAKGVFCKLPDGQIYYGKVWPGVSAYPDFSNPKTREWWADLHTALFDAGVEGVWNDMNEPSDFSQEVYGDRTTVTVPSEVMMDEDGRPRSFDMGHNAYGFDMNRSTAIAFEKFKANERPFVLTRAGYAGIQRYAAVWTGDNHSWWEHLSGGLPMLLNLSMSGVPFCGGDAGGFQGDADDELFARWIQFAAFTPFFRAHSTLGSKDHEPWSFGPEVEDIAREYIRLRYSLMPYLYGEFRHAALTGQAIMRALVLDYPDDPESHKIHDQYLFGRSILVAPVQKPGAAKRMVYLPKGLWYDFHSKKPVEGGRYIIADAPLTRMPMYVKAGAVIPSCIPADHTGILDLSKLALDVYSGAAGIYELYEDDGATLNHLKGEYNLTRYTVSKDAGGKTSLSSETLHKGYKGGCAKPEIQIIG